MTKLTIKDHSRVFYDFTYVYPVVSRRSEGVSLGINLNINNACNWRCVYCQVDGLVRGKPEAINLERLSYELDYMINYIVNGEFLAKYAPLKFRRFNDICLSGNGESTLAHEFLAVIKIIADLRKKYQLTDNVKTILITNGSEVERPDITNALSALSHLNGEVWFKVDSASKSGINQVNQVVLSVDGVKKRLLLASTLCKTYIQTCMFRRGGVDPDIHEVDEYINFVTSVRNSIAGVLLYSTARNPALPEGHDISSVSEEFLADIADRLAKSGVLVKYYQ
jgi:wyosine [tRNA(Phe)-imidazoG37] synthetase (radical SAM superfamily)